MPAWTLANIQRYLPTHVEDYQKYGDVLSARVWTAIWNGHVPNLATLFRMTDAEIVRIRNVSRHTLTLIREAQRRGGYGAGWEAWDAWAAATPGWQRPAYACVAATPAVPAVPRRFPMIVQPSWYRADMTQAEYEHERNLDAWGREG